MSSARRAEIARRIARHRARARRRPILLAGGAAVTVALATALSIASFTGVDLANAAVERAKSLAELINMRSPGERTQGDLTKTKHKALAENVPVTPPVLAEALAPPVAALVPVSLDVPPIAQFAQPIPPGISFTPPPGVFVPPCCSDVPLVPPPPGPPPPPPGPPPPPPGPPPPPPPGPPPPPPPPPPPAVPEPGTWMTMVLGFGLTGWQMRRRPKRSVRSTI